MPKTRNAFALPPKNLIENYTKSRQEANSNNPDNASSTSHMAIKASMNSEDNTPELLVYDTIGAGWFSDGVTAEGIHGFLQEHKDEDIRVLINSRGGDAFEGITIYNTLIKHSGNVETVVEGLASSAASIITVAGNVVKMHENASFFIHRAWGGAVGNSADMLDYADWLTKLDEQLALTLASRSDLNTPAVAELMVGKVDGSILSAKQSLEYGFIDEIIPVRSKDEDDEENEKRNLLNKAHRSNMMKPPAPVIPEPDFRDDKYSAVDENDDVFNPLDNSSMIESRLRVIELDLDLSQNLIQ